MSTKFFEYSVNENEFGSSTSIAVKIENGKVVESFDTSTYETNWIWDGGFEDGLFVGDTVKEMHQKLTGWFADFEDEFRHPYIVEHPLTREVWQSIKFQREQEKIIAAKRKQRAIARKQNKDMLAEKERVLNASKKLKAHFSDKEVADARIQAYKKFV